MLYQENQIKMPEKTEKRLSELMLANQMREVITVLMDIIENYYRYEIYKCVQFDPNTGEKLRFDWRDEGRFSWHIPLHESYNADIKFHSDITEFFRTEVMRKDKVFYFTYKNQAYAISNYWGHYYDQWVCEGIKIQPLEALPL